MENSSLKTLLATPEETEEPWPKKLKIDSNQVIFEKGQQQLLEICCENKKSANEFLCFPKTLWNFSQHNLELQEQSSTNLKTSERQHAHFNMYMNANLQSRLLGNIPHIDKWCPNSCTTGNANSSCTTIRNANREFKKNNSDLIKLESLVSYAKETATKTANTSKANEWPARGILFYIILAEKFIARIGSLFGDVPEFQNNENGPSCPVCKMLRSEEKYLISKPVKSDENINEEILKFCLPVMNFMNRKKSDSGSLIYEYKNVLYKNSDILSCKKQKRFSGKNNFRRNKVFQHRYIPYSRNRGYLSPKLAKDTAFELFLQSKRTYHNSTVTENGIPVLNHIIQLNHQQTEKSNEEGTIECLLCPTDIREDDIFSILCYGKEQIASQIIFYNNQILPDKNFSITLWERSLYIPKTIHNLADNFRLLNYLISIPIMFEKSNIKHLKLEMITMKQFVQKKNRKACNQTKDFSFKKIKSYFVLGAHNKCENRRFRNSINCTSNKKYVRKYIETCSKDRMNKTQYGNHKHGQNNPCVFVDRKSHFETYKKICLNSYLEEIEHNSVLENVIFTDEKYSKGCIIADKRFTSICFETLTYICVPLKLYTNYSCLLKHKNKSKRSQYFKDSQWLKQEISGKLFPINSRRLLKHSLDVNQYFTPDMFHKLCLNQNIAVSAEAKLSKTSLCGKRAKQNCFEFEKLKSVLQYQYQTIWISKISKVPKAKKIGNVNFSDGKNILFSDTLMPKLLFVNQTVGDVNKTENAIAEQSYINKRNQYQNLCELYFKEACAKSVNSVDKLAVASCSTKQKSFEDSREGHFSSEINRKEQFDLVLEELRMFNEISKENENSLSQAEINILEKEPLVLNCSDNIPDQVNGNIHQHSVISTTGITMTCASGVKQNRYKKGLFKQIIQSGEQEIPHDYSSSSISDEELFCSSSEERAHCRQSFPWNPAFISQTFMREGSCNLTTERGNCLLSGIIRIQPLKTCCGPLRVGLSRKAKLKQLHPYLK